MALELEKRREPVRPPFVDWREPPQPVSVKTELIKLIRGFGLPELEEQLILEIRRLPDEDTIPALLADLRDIDSGSDEMISDKTVDQIFPMAKAFEPVAKKLAELGIPHGIGRNLGLRALMQKYEVHAMSLWEDEKLQELNDIDVVVHSTKTKAILLIKSLKDMKKQGLIENLRFQTNYHKPYSLLKVKDGHFASGNLYISFLIDGVEVEIFDDFYYLKDSSKSEFTRDDGICLTHLDAQGKDTVGTDTIETVTISKGLESVLLNCLHGYGTLLSYLLQANADAQKFPRTPGNGSYEKYYHRFQFAAVLVNLIRASGFVPHR